MPHLERWSEKEKAWIRLEGTSHNRDPLGKSPRVRKIHGILEDTEGVREVGDNQGQPCLKVKERKRYTIVREDDWHPPIDVIIL